MALLTWFAHSELQNLDCDCHLSSTQSRYLCFIVSGDILCLGNIRGKSENG